jgi:predicted DNA-binding transcriptional regulator AlpA
MQEQQQHEVAAETGTVTATAHTSFVIAFIRIGRVKEISGLSKSTLHRWMYGTPGDPAKGVPPQPARGFPLPVIKSGNTVLWDLYEVLEWRKRQFAKREEIRVQKEKSGGV